MTQIFQDVKMIEPNSYSGMQTQVLLLFSFFGIWLLLISVVLYKIWFLFDKLTKGVEVTDLKKVLEKVLEREDQGQKKIGELGKRIDWLEGDSKFYIQKIGVARFNPFKELGGDHSFSLAILDKEDSGVIITSLHTRDRTRVYMKDVKGGKSNSELSVDEKKALTLSQK